MQNVIVSDTSCLILLKKINRLGLLKPLFHEITITQVVAEEYANPLPDFIHIQNPTNLPLQKKMETMLDAGEASCLALSLELENCFDLKARKKAVQLGVEITGTLGLFLIAKEKGYINTISSVIDEIKKTDFRISEKYFDYIKQKTEE